MTHAEIATMIASIGVPYAYYQFPEGTGQAPPFICFFYSYSNDEVADNTNYQKIDHLVIELYTENKDFNMEKAVEGALSEAGLVYARQETYVDTERLFEVVFETDVIITEDENGNN